MVPWTNPSLKSKWQLESNVGTPLKHVVKYFQYSAESRDTETRQRASTSMYSLTFRVLP